MAAWKREETGALMMKDSKQGSQNEMFPAGNAFINDTKNLT
jgi:hypothetical protein